MNLGLMLTRPPGLVLLGFATSPLSLALAVILIFVSQTLAWQLGKARIFGSTPEGNNG